MEGMREHTVDGTLQEGVNDEETVITQDTEEQWRWGLVHSSMVRTC